MAKRNKQKSASSTTAKQNIPAPSENPCLGCIIPNFLYLAPVSASGNTNLLQREGITHIISIGKNPMTRVDGITYHKFGLLDNEQADLRAVGDKVCEVLDTLMPPTSRRRPSQQETINGAVDGGDEEYGELLEAEQGPRPDIRLGQAEARSGKEATGSTNPEFTNGEAPQTGTDRNSKVLIHCSAAISRSPAVVAGYLMKRRGMTLRESLEALVRAREAVSPNVGFLRQLCEIEREVFGLADGERSSFDVESFGSGTKLAKLLKTS